MAVAGGVLLVGSMFLDWYGYGGVEVTGWQAFTAADILLAALAAAIALAAGLGALRGEIPAVRVASGLVIGVCGLAALAVVAIRVAAPPGPPAVLGVVGVSIDATRHAGAFIALAGALAMAAGGVAAASAAVLDGVSRAFERLNQDT